MKSSTIFAVFVLVAMHVGFNAPAQAFDIDGAWTTSTDVCTKVFSKNATSFAQDSDIYGTGFIINGNAIHAQTGKCTIKARKNAGDVAHLLAVCSTGIMVDQMQFSYKVVDDNRITRLFPGMEGFETSYVRCPVAK